MTNDPRMVMNLGGMPVMVQNPLMMNQNKKV